jgi:protein TonB
VNRYLNSFFIAFSCYALFIVGIFYIFTNNKIIDIQDEPKTISLSHIELESENKIEQNQQEKTPINEEKKETKKIVEKQIEKPIEKQKTTITKKIETKEIAKEELTQKSETNESTQKQTQNQSSSTEIQTTTSTKPVIDEKKEYLDKYLSQIRDSINKNVTYPSKAKKLLIEGTVIVKFKITENGSVEDITIIDGHKFLQSSTIEAIEEASKEFPKTNKSIEIQIPIEYKLI